MKKVGLALVAILICMSGCADNIEDGVNYLKKENYEEAVKAFQKDIKEGDNLAEAYRGIGIAYFELEEYESAVESLELAIKNEAAKTAELYSILGACHMELANYDEALESYEKALKKKDITKELKQEVQFNLIAVYEFMGDWEAAKAQMELYVETYPDDTRVEKEADFLETR